MIRNRKVTKIVGLGWGFFFDNIVLAEKQREKNNAVQIRSRN